MFNLILSLIPSGIALFYFIYSIKNRKRIKNISNALLNGEVCYKCKSDIPLSSNEIIRNSFDNKEHISLCRSCERDLKINGLLNKGKLIEKINTKIISKKVFSRIMLTSGIIMAILLIITILTLLNNIEFPNYILNIFLTIYWAFLIYREKLVTIKTKNRL